MRISLLDPYGKEVLRWDVPDSFVDMGKWQRCETGRDERYGFTVEFLREPYDPESSGTNPGT